MNTDKRMKVLRQMGLLGSLLLAAPVLAGESDPSAFDCLIEPHTVVDVNSAVQGKIDTITVEKSDLVKQGQTLVELESEVEKASVALAQARTEMNAELKTRSASYDFARRKLTRFDDLYQDEVVPLHNKDEVETEATLAALQIRQARENQHLAELELKREIALLNQRTVHSPITGVVVERFKSPGEFAEDEPILRLAQLDPLNVEVILPATMFGKIKRGSHAEVKPESSGESAYTAAVKIVDLIVDASSGTFGVRLELPNPDYKIPGGLKCSLQFQDSAPVVSRESPRKKPAHRQPASEQPVPALSATPPYKVVRFTPPAPACHTLGPFENSDQADQLTTVLEQEAVRISRREENQSKVSDYIVAIPPQQTHKNTQQLATQLRKSGVEDMAVLKRGPFRRHISLGVYRDKGFAERRRASLAKLGFESVILPRYRQESQVWLDVSLPHTGPDAATFARLVEQTVPGLVSQPQDCLQVAGL